MPTTIPPRDMTERWAKTPLPELMAQAARLRDLGHGNVDDREARAQDIAQDAGMRAFHAGPLANSVVAEALTSVPITINRQYKVKHSGITVTGLPARATDA